MGGPGRRDRPGLKGSAERFTRRRRVGQEVQKTSPVESVLKLVVLHPQTVQPPQHGVADDRNLFGRGFNGGQIIDCIRLRHDRHLLSVSVCFETEATPSLMTMTSARSKRS